MQGSAAEQEPDEAECDVIVEPLGIIEARHATVHDASQAIRAAQEKIVALQVQKQTLQDKLCNIQNFLSPPRLPQGD